MPETFTAFDWDAGNRAKCQKHGVTIAEIEALFSEPLLIVPDATHSETRIRAIGRTGAGPNDIFGVYDTAQGRSASGSADQCALYARERGRFL